MAKIKPQALLQQSKKKKGPSQISASTIVLYGVVVILLVFFGLASYRHWIQRSVCSYFGFVYILFCEIGYNDMFKYLAFFLSPFYKNSKLVWSVGGLN